MILKGCDSSSTTAKYPLCLAALDPYKRHSFLCLQGFFSSFGPICHWEGGWKKWGINPAGILCLLKGDHIVVRPGQCCFGLMGNERWGTYASFFWNQECQTIIVKETDSRVLDLFSLIQWIESCLKLFPSYFLCHILNGGQRHSCEEWCTGRENPVEIICYYIVWWLW